MLTVLLYLTASPALKGRARVTSFSSAQTGAWSPIADTNTAAHRTGFRNRYILGVSFRGKKCCQRRIDIETRPKRTADYIMNSCGLLKLILPALLLNVAAIAKAQ